jgi:TRAP transporter TAXI family solute receptor
MEVLLNAKGWTKDDFALATEIKASEQSAALCDNQIDAMAYTVGHPSGSIQEATTACDSVLVNVTGDAVAKLIADNPFYRTATVPGGMYRGSDGDVETFGVGAPLVSSADVSEDAVYALVSAVFENFDDFKKLHPAFGHLKAEQMIADGLSAPLHPGAKKYYVEKGWMN